MIIHLASLITAYLLDWIFGDPYNFPHPIKYIGRLIRHTEKQIRKYVTTPRGLRYAGWLLWGITVGVTVSVVYGLLVVSKVHWLVYYSVNSVLLYTCLATKCLGDEGDKIKKVLEQDTLEAARTQLSYIVGRDTTKLNEEEIIRATVETVAENTVDGVTAPLFYAFIGGAPLAFMYKAINTLDSTVGYKNEKYKDLGKVSAKIDDVANFIPARVTAVLMAGASILLGYDGKASLQIAIRDRKNHKSPNCAYPEGATAGALGVQLGGTNSYFGELVVKPTIGDKKRPLEKMDITRSIRLMYMTSLVAFLGGVGISLLLI